MSLLLLFSISFALCFILTALFLRYLKILNVRQIIREEGPSSHITKSGTPTMGGIIFISVFLILSFITTKFDSKIISLLLLVFGFALIGFLDDFVKIIGKRNLGLTPSQKMGLQVLAALIWGSYLLFQGHEGNIYGWIYLPFIVLLIIGMSNAANLTDGLDGLLAGASIISLLSLGVIAVRVQNSGIASVCIISSAVILAFLFFNLNPAKIFMGDTGSLGIGALISGIAVLLHKELLLLIVGGVFVIETLSVIIQVISFRLTGRRIFKMSPLHHHFELSGFSERKVVLGFWTAALIFGVIGALIG